MAFLTSSSSQGRERLAGREARAYPLRIQIQARPGARRRCDSPRRRPRTGFNLLAPEPACASSRCAPCCWNTLGLVFGASSMYIVPRWVYGQRLDSGRRHSVTCSALSKLGMRASTILEKTCANRRLWASRSHRLVHHAGAHDPRLRLESALLLSESWRVAGSLRGSPAPRAHRAQHGSSSTPRNRRPSAQSGRFRRVAAAHPPRRGARSRSHGAGCVRARGPHHFHGVRNRALVQDLDVLVQALEGRAGEGLRKAVRGRFHLRRNLAGADRRRLHHRPLHRFRDVRRRRARLPASHPDDQVLRFVAARAARARHDADLRDDAGRHS